jgi:predicted nucleic acid-binding protein
MIILDTNVVSELMRVEANENVKRWLSNQIMSNLALTSITIAEIQRGLERLPIGKRRKKLEESFSLFFMDAFNNRIFSFDEESAYMYGKLSSKREKAGLHTDAVDMMIAAIAKVHKASIATRNVSDFESCGIKIINPWKT